MTPPSTVVVMFVLLTRGCVGLRGDRNESNQNFQEKFDHDLEAALAECSYPDTDRSHGHNSTEKSETDTNNRPSSPHHSYIRSTVGNRRHNGAENTQADTNNRAQNSYITSGNRYNSQENSQIDTYNRYNNPESSQTDTNNRAQKSYTTSGNRYNSQDNSQDTYNRYNNPESSQTDTYNQYNNPESSQTDTYNRAQNPQSSAGNRQNSRSSSQNTDNGRDSAEDDRSRNDQGWSTDSNGNSSVFIPFSSDNNTSVYRYRERAPQNLHTAGTRLGNYSRKAGGHPKVTRSTYDARSGDVPACTVLCVLATLKVVDARGVPVETSLVKLLEDGVDDRQRRHAMIQRVASCFKTTPTEQGDDNCSLAKTFTSCFGFKFDKKSSNISAHSEM